MKCTVVQDILKSDYLDGELNQKLRQQIEGHLQTCPTCQASKEELESLRVALRGAQRKKVPAEIWQNIQSAIIEEQLKEPESIPGYVWTRLKRVFSLPRPALAFTSAVAVIIVSLVAGKTILNNDQYTTSTVEEDILQVYQVNGDIYTYNLGTAIEEYFL